MCFNIRKQFSEMKRHFSLSWMLVGRFFEVLIGARPEPLWRLLSKIGLLYALEPIFTVIFVVNMSTVWENVMSIIRAQIFRRVLIQKVICFFSLFCSLLIFNFCCKVHGLMIYVFFLLWCRRSFLTDTRFASCFINYHSLLYK